MNKLLISSDKIILLMALLYIVTPGFAITATLYSKSDSYVDQNVPTANYGTAITMDVMSYNIGPGNRRSFVLFDLSTIPAVASIQTATLKLYLDTAPAVSRNCDAHRITEDWVEGTINWSNQPATDINATATQPTGTISGVWLSFDVTSDVSAFTAGTYTNYGWRIKDQAENSGTDYYSVFRTLQYPGITYDPQLVVTYTLPVYTLTYTAGLHGTIIGSSPQMVEYGGSGTEVTASPDGGCQFINWSDGVLTATRVDTNVTTDISVIATFNITPTPTPFVQKPHLVNAIFCDANGNGNAEPGETLTLVFDQGVTITKSLITPDCFYLPVNGDSLGSGGFDAFINLYSSCELVLTFGAGAHLTIDGIFSETATISGSPSGIDLSVNRPTFSIRSLDGLVDSIDLGNPSSNDSGLDIKYSFKPVMKDVGSDGGTLDTSSDPDSAYHHIFNIPAGSITTTNLTMKSPYIPTPPPGCVTHLPIGAAQILANTDNVTFLTPATLTLEYLDGDANTDLGFAKAGMRMYTYVQDVDGCWHWIPVPGEQIVDTENNTVTAYLSHISFAGTTGGLRLFSPGDVGIFGNLPGSTIEENTINIKPQGGGMVKILSNPILTPGANGYYTQHRIEFPNYVETVATDPNVIKVTIKQATLADRTAQSGGNSFPTASYALFVILTKDYNNQSVSFNSPVNIRVQFMNGTANSFNDIWKFDNTAGKFNDMAIVKDTVAGTGVDFQFIQGVTQSISNITGGGYVEGSGITGLTDSQGKGVWGAVSKTVPISSASTPWAFYD